MENASHIYDSNQVKKMIKRQKERYGWGFMFVAANIDAVETARNIGICEDMSATYNQTKEGNRSVYEATDSLLRSVRYDCRDIDDEWENKIK